MALLKRSPFNIFSPFRSFSLPNVCIWVMGLYLLIDLGTHLSRSGIGETSHLAKQNLSDLALPDQRGCNSVDDYIDVREDQVRSPQDPWYQLKWGLPPSQCTVKGHLIERLDPLNNYRRGVALGFTSDLDDKTHLEHWFLGARENLNKAKRRVYIDIGANLFTSSIEYFLTRYPVDFTEVYAFEIDSSLLSLPSGWNEDANQVDSHEHGWKKLRSRDGVVPSWILDRVRLFIKAAGVRDSIDSVNMTRFIKDELKLKAEDSVIVKMDIEGAEWPILHEWVKDPDMPFIIDELFVELHYFHPDNNWMSVSEWSREDATRMLAELRSKGFYAHYWD